MDITSFIKDNLKVLKIAFKFTSNATKPVLQGVLIDSNNIVATNGIIMYIKKHNTNIDKSFVISKDILKACNKAIKIVLNDDNIICYYNDNTSIKNYLISYTYPEYKRLIPDLSLYNNSFVVDINNVNKDIRKSDYVNNVSNNINTDDLILLQPMIDINNVNTDNIVLCSTITIKLAKAINKKSLIVNHSNNIHKPVIIS